MRTSWIVVAVFAASGCDAAVDAEMQSIENKVATDAVDQYNIAKQSGGPMDACVAAGMVTAAYLQAEDQANYSRWKATKRVDCQAAGLPQQ